MIGRCRQRKRWPRVKRAAVAALPCSLVRAVLGSGLDRHRSGLSSNVSRNSRSITSARHRGRTSQSEGHVCSRACVAESGLARTRKENGRAGGPLAIGPWGRRSPLTEAALGAKKRADKSASRQVVGTGEPYAAARVSLLPTQRNEPIGQRVDSKWPCSPDQTYRVPCCGTQERADEIPLPV